MRKQNYTPEQQNALLNALAIHYQKDVLTSREIEDYCKKFRNPYPHFIFNPKASYKVKWGHYRVRGETPKTPTSDVSLAAMVVTAPSAQTAPVAPLPANVLQRKVAADTNEKFLVDKDPTYVPFGFYNDLKQIIASKIFYTVYITGLSGNGKTKMVEQVCAQLAEEGRELVRVNITKETDETDLLGAYDLIDGNTVRRDGPVTIAMKRGAVLLLDEVDLGSERLLCLQPILEGKPFFDKKTGTIVAPQPGFNIIATANTKGKGSDDGRFIGANVLNEAFLERFAITVEQDYPPEKTERNILIKNMDALSIKDDGFAGNLVKWANLTRKTFAQGAADELISTRRLVHIINAYGIFKNKMKAIELCLNRFDDETKATFIDGYTKVDEEAVPHVAANTEGYIPEANDPVERLQKTVQSTVMPAAVQKPIGSIPTHNTPTPAPVQSKAPKAPATMPNNNMPAWASAQYIMRVTMQMQETSPIEIAYDAGSGCHFVTAYGIRAKVNPNGIASTMNPDGVLKSVVDYCYQMKTNGTGINSFE